MKALKQTLRWSLAPLVLTGLLAMAAQPASAQRPSVTFDNQSGEFALVKLVGPTPRTVSVSNRRTATVNVSGGTYYILVRYGHESEAYRYTRGESFHVTDTGCRYSQIRITLHGVINGNYSTWRSSADEFNRAGGAQTSCARPSDSVRLDDRSGTSVRVEIGPAPKTVSVPPGHSVIIDVAGGASTVIVRHGAAPKPGRCVPSTILSVGDGEFSYSWVRKISDGSVTQNWLIRSCSGPIFLDAGN